MCYIIIGDNMKIIVATKYKDRLLGNMFKNKIKTALCFPKCNSIHTFFMLKPIDIIMTDKNHIIMKKYINFKPWKIIFPKKNVYYTYEYPALYLKDIALNNYFNPLENSSNWTVFIQYIQIHNLKFLLYHRQLHLIRVVFDQFHTF